MKNFTIRVRNGGGFIAKASYAVREDVKGILANGVLTGDMPLLKVHEKRFTQQQNPTPFIPGARVGPSYNDVYIEDIEAWYFDGFNWKPIPGTPTSQKLEDGVTTLVFWGTVFGPKFGFE